MLRYLHLQDGVYLVPGIARAAIYDTKSGNVYSINQEAMNIILKASTGGMSEENRFVQNLISKNLFIWKDMEGPRIDCLYKECVIGIHKPKLDFFWAELTGKCNLLCKHCYADANPYNDMEELSTDEWKDLLSQGFSQGATSVQFIGGEPLLRKDLLLLVSHANSLGYKKIEIFTNGTLITNRFLDQLAHIPGICFAISLYSDQEQVHDAVTGIKGSWSKTVHGIEQIKCHNYPIRIALIIMHMNEVTYESTFSFCNKMGIGCPHPDIVRASGRAISSLRPSRIDLLEKFYKLKPEFYTSEDKFHRSINYNTCWANKLAITPSGEVIPCIFARDTIIGNVKTSKLSDILKSENIVKLWGLTKDQVEVCNKCEYRYACKDCRPLAISQSNNIFGKNPRCMYDPSTGLWSSPPHA